MNDISCAGVVEASELPVISFLVLLLMQGKNKGDELLVH